jgi:hypothetical protein
VLVSPSVVVVRLFDVEVDWGLVVIVVFSVIGAVVCGIVVGTWLSDVLASL